MRIEEGVRESKKRGILETPDSVGDSMPETARSTPLTSDKFPSPMGVNEELRTKKP
ncbi:MAG: hypothetical protein NPIRA06_29150 [Nitrospirales bacterium]|nr:MAG: hypothetical protein NPIRA06_29150 [Nitrospirales bacterium]